MKDLLTTFKLPFIKIHGVYIGGYYELEEIVVNDLLDVVLDKGQNK